MIKIIDNTLTTLDRILPSKEDLHTFCQLLFTLGVDAIEMSRDVYERMEYLPDNQKFILDIDLLEERELYPGFYRYVSRHIVCDDNLIYELQMNDAREIVKLRALKGCKELRIVGLDDLICYDSFEKILKEIIDFLPKTSVILCPENTYGCASALAIQWVTGFGSNITTSFAGCKNNAATEEVMVALRLAVRYKISRDLTVLSDIKKLYEKFISKSIGNKKAIIGSDIFKVEAGIHADGINKNPATYEAFDPRIVGGKTELVIGKHSGTRSIRLKLEELKLPVPGDFVITKILDIVKEDCTAKRRSLSDTEFVGIVREVIRNERKQIHR